MRSSCVLRARNTVDLRSDCPGLFVNAILRSMSACGPEGLVIDFGSQRTQRDEVVQVDEDCKINLPGGFNLGWLMGIAQLSRRVRQGRTPYPRPASPKDD